jgi:glycosyltransferase involved in cell wall biosynthesis
VALSFGMLSTYPPTQCGIATFSASLSDALTEAGDSTSVVRLVDEAEPLTGRVIHHFVRDRGSIAAAASALDGHDVVVVQHEFGLYGGPDGAHVLDVIDLVVAPIIVIAHTVLSAPSTNQRAILERLVDRADALVVMSMTARDRLLAGYQVDASKVVVIPHGAVTESAVTATHRRPGPPRLLTWGLLGPGKGIEGAIDALSQLQTLDPAPRYRIVGQTHPRVFARDGESYRMSLAARATDRGVADLVSFQPAYLDSGALRRVIAEADVVVLPYESREQVTSGVLIEAVAARKPVVATAFPHAVELLASGAGLVVPHADPDALAHAVHRVLTEPDLAATMTRHAAAAAPDLRWSEVATRYRALGADLVDARTSLAVR